MLLKSQKELKSDQWEVIEFPAILPSGKPVWPEYWKLDELEACQSFYSVGKWNAQWMQNPTAEEGSLIKREWWKVWDKGYIPPSNISFKVMIQPFLKKKLLTILLLLPGVYFIQTKITCLILILLRCIKERLEFPELRKEA